MVIISALVIFRKFKVIFSIELFLFFRLISQTYLNLYMFLLRANETFVIVIADSQLECW